VLNYAIGSSAYYGGHGLTPPEPYSLEWHANYEYYLSLVYKTLLWTMPAKLPRIALTGLPANGGVSVAVPGAFATTLRCASTQAGVDATVLATVRDTLGAVEHQAIVPLRLNPGDNPLTVDIPALKAGGHFLDLIVKSGAATEEWGSVYFTVQGALTLVDVVTDKQFCEKGETVNVTAKLSALPSGQASVRISLSDTAGRLFHVAEQAVPAGQQEVLFAVSLDGATTLATRLDAELRVGGSVEDATYRFLFQPRRYFGGASDLTGAFRSIMWGGVSCNRTGLGWLALQQLRNAGFNGLLNHPSATADNERAMALCDFPLVSYSYRIMGGVDDKGWRKDEWADLKKVEDGCFYNPEIQQKARDSVVGRVTPVIPYGPVLYTLGDENYYSEKSGLSPIGQTSFREYVQKQYGTLESLNKVWGTQYGDWAQIELLPRDEALKKGFWPMVHAHMGFNETEYADYHHFLSAAIKSVDKFAKVGAEGSEPGDLEKTIEGEEIWGPYSDKRGNELLRSLVTPEVVRGNWWGGYVGSHGARAGAINLWDQLINGAVNTSLFFAAIGSEGLFATDLSFAAYFEAMQADLGEIYGGTGQLLAASRVADDGIAIHWSQAGEHASTFFTAAGSPSHSQGSVLGLLDRCGFGYRYLTTRMIGNGELAKGGVRVLFLACSQAISDKEAEAIRAFVKAGGTVIADVAPGVLGAHCEKRWPADAATPWAAGLDDLFGVARKGEPRAKQETASISVRLGENDLKLTDYPLRPDVSVTGPAAGADVAALGAVGGVPVVFAGAVNGAGRVIFLNFPFPSAEHPEGPAFMRTLLAVAGLKSTCELANGKDWFFRRFRNGDLTLIGIVLRGKTAGDAQLVLAEPACVYDVRAGKYLGRTATAAIAADGPQARVFAILKSPTKKLKLDAAKRVKPGASVTVKLRLDAGDANPAGRLVRLQWFRPDGTESMPYRACLTLTGSELDVTITTALNDPPGEWKIVATDVATGTRGEREFKLK